MDNVLRPRDIQARIRSGESPETVAAAAGTTVDKIQGYATPVLAEREYIAQQALKASVRRRAGDGPIGHLGDAVAQRLSEQDVDPASVAWDAWRREDGRWTLVADYGDARRAQFVFDAAGRYVVADDDESRRLVGERVPGEQLPLGEDAIQVVTGLRSVPDVPDEATTDLAETAAAVRRAEPAGADWIRTQASDRPVPAQEPAAASAPSADTLFDATDLAEQAPPTTAHSSAAEDDAAPEPTRKRARGRASVPSWDEIMFGSSKGD